MPRLCMGLINTLRPNPSPRRRELNAVAAFAASAGVKSFGFKHALALTSSAGACSPATTPRDDGRRRWPMQPARPRGAVLKAFTALHREAGQPFAHRPRADACGACGGLRRLPAQNLLHNPLSTKRRQTGILVDVHSVPPRITEVGNLSFLGRDRVDNLLKAHI